MAVGPGARVGPYEIVAPLGAGGMGEVYRARDTRLRRDVAIKVLPAEAATDPERLRRFEQEARATAALNHPNILTVYDVGTHEGTPYLAEELLVGETLRERLTDGPMPVRKTVEVGVQIARGLAAAHAKDIVHRDLKPENVFITTDGAVKILDFGLARLRGTAPGGRGHSEATTRLSATEHGAVLGTVGYMSPEQVRGHDVDERTDIFAFGCVLYEMLSGARPFRGETGADTIAAILGRDPEPLGGGAGEIPAVLEEIVHRCLEKRADDRFSSAHDLALALQATRSDSGGADPGRPVGTPTGKRRVTRWSAAGVLGLVVAVVAAVVWLRPRYQGGKGTSGLDPRRVMVGEFDNLTGDPALAPAGRMVAAAVSQGLVEVGGLDVVASPSREHAAVTGEEELRTTARATGAGTLVTGGVYLNAGQLEFRGRISDVGTGKLLYALKPEAGPRNAPAEAIDRVRQRVMGAMLLRLGEAPGLGGITVPPLYSAYQEYIAGSSAMGVDRKAVFEHLERAAQLDPEFWHPQLRLMAWYKWAGNAAKYEAMRLHLQENQDKFGPTDRVMLQYYDAQLHGRTLETYRRARELLALAPHDFTYIFGAAVLAQNLNRPREALDCVGDVEKIDWKILGRWIQGTWLLNVASFCHHLLGEDEAALAVAEFGERLYPDMLNVRADKVRALAALGRIADVDRTIAESLTIRSQTEMPGSVMIMAAEELRAHGHADDAHRIAAQCAEWYAGLTGVEATHASVPSARAECLWLAERWQDARAYVVAVADGRPTNPVLAGYGGILAAKTGDRAAAQTVETQLALLDDTASRGRFSWLRACIVAQLGDRDRAVGLLRDALGHGFTDVAALHVYVFLEPLHGYAPFEELIEPKG
ncbi:MAG: protein kinase domain-containing protein [Acidobacteriota bacterium]